MQAEVLVLPYHDRPYDGTVGLRLLDLGQDGFSRDQLVRVVCNLRLSSRQDGGHLDPDAGRHVAPDEHISGPELHSEAPCRE